MRTRKRTCAWCGSLLDPIDYCLACRVGEDCDWHAQRRRGGRARFCDRRCRALWWRERRLRHGAGPITPCPRTLPLPLEL